MGDRRARRARARRVRRCAQFPSVSGWTRATRFAAPTIRRRVAVDPERLHRLSRLRAIGRRARRIQRQVDVRPVGVARRVVRYPTVPCARDVPQLFPVRCALAVHGPAPGEERMSASMHPQRAARGARPLETSEILADVLHGLGGTQKTLPPKLFYDDVGARLFERICTLDEYYLTRSEFSILRERAGEIADFIGPRVALVEYGSGAAIKVRFLLDALRHPAAYVPIDISREQLARVAAELEADYPSLAVRPICGDYTRLLPLPSLPPHSRRAAFFPGSTIGNFHPAEAAAFLTRIRRTVGTGGALVIGVDRRKDAAVLHAAYDDPQGVTAAFNRNLLRRINRELGADFDLASFRHVAFFNDD